MLRKREKAGKKWGREGGRERGEVREEGRHEESVEEVINVDEDVRRAEDKGSVKLWTAQLSQIRLREHHNKLWNVRK